MKHYDIGSQSVPVRVFTEVGSTNTELMKLALQGERGPLWLRAERQMSGKGRDGRTWISEPGNLYASLLITLRCEPGAASQLSLVTGVAVFQAVAAISGGIVPDGLALKWPNDVLIGGAKCAGILTEAISDPATGAVVAIIGIGVNLAHHPSDAGRPTTHLGAHGLNVVPAVMLGHVHEALHDTLDLWEEGRAFGRVLERWRQFGTRPGQRISVNSNGVLKSGSFSHLADDGALILCDDKGYLHRITFGDVSFVSPTQG